MPQAELPKVSVNVVTYNQEAFLAETLDSILSQDYPNIEIIITDDASKDATQSIATAYANKHPGIIRTVFSQVNTGISLNANRGLMLCTGKYICPFAGDDLLLPGKLTAQVALMESDPTIPMSYHNVEWFESETGAHLRNHFEPGRHPVPTENPQDLFTGNPIPGPGVMLRRSMMSDTPNHPDFPFSSDWLHWIILSRLGPIRYLPGTYARYRRHSQNETLINPKIGAEQLRFIHYLRQHFPDAPQAALRQAEALSWQASAIGHMGTGNYYAALAAYGNVIRNGRFTRKNFAVMAICLVGLNLPKWARIALARRLIAQRFN